MFRIDRKGASGLMSTRDQRSGEFDTPVLRAVDEAEAAATNAELDAFLKPVKTKLSLRQVAMAAVLEDFKLAVAALRRTGWSEAAVARSIGQSPQHLQDLLAGKRNLQGWHLKALPPIGRRVISHQLGEGVPYDECHDPPSWVGRTG
jgi:hypothetical protein